MPVKVKVSYTPDDESVAVVKRIKARLAAILPRHKVKKSAGTPPFKHLYFTPANSKKSEK